MYEDTVVSFSHPDRISIEDPLTEVLQAGARRLLAEAVEVEVSAFIAEHADFVDGAGHRRVIRHGYLPEREVQTGIGPISVRRAFARDCRDWRPRVGKRQDLPRGPGTRMTAF